MTSSEIRSDQIIQNDFHQTLDYLLKDCVSEYDSSSKNEENKLDDTISASIEKSWHDMVNSYVDSLKPKDVIICIESIKFLNKSTVFMKELRVYLDLMLKYLNGGEPLKNDFGRDKYTNFYSLYSYTKSAVVEEIKDTALIYEIMEKIDSFNFTENDISNTICLDNLLHESTKKFLHFDTIRENHPKRKRYLIVINCSTVNFNEDENFELFKTKKIHCTFFCPQKLKELECMSKLLDFNNKSKDLLSHLNLLKWSSCYCNGLIDAFDEKSSNKKITKDLTDGDYDLMSIVNIENPHVSNFDPSNQMYCISQANNSMASKNHQKLISSCQGYKMPINQQLMKVQSGHYLSQDQALTPNNSVSSNHCSPQLSSNLHHSNNTEMIKVIPENSMVESCVSIDNQYIPTNESGKYQMNISSNQMRYSQQMHCSIPNRLSSSILFEGNLRYNNEDSTQLQINIDSNVDLSLYSMLSWENQCHLKFYSTNDYIRILLFGKPRNDNEKDSSDNVIKSLQELTYVMNPKANEFIKEYLSQNKFAFGFVRPNKNISFDIHMQIFCFVFNGEVKAFVPADVKGLLDEIRKPINPPNPNMPLFDHSRRVNVFPNQHIPSLQMQPRSLMNRYVAQPNQFMSVPNTQFYRTISNSPYATNSPIPMSQGFLVNNSQYQGINNPTNMVPIDSNIQSNHQVYDPNCFLK